MTNSPANFNAVQHANAVLVHLIQSRQPLPSPAKNYIEYLTQSYEHTHLENRILYYENEYLKESMGHRGRVLSGKRQAIDGKHLMTIPEILGSIKGAEKLTQLQTQKEMGSPKSGDCEVKRKWLKSLVKNQM